MLDKSLVIIVYQFLRTILSVLPFFQHNDPVNLQNMSRENRIDETTIFSKRYTTLTVVKIELRKKIHRILQQEN